MSAQLALENLVAYSVQLALIVGAGLLLPGLLRVRRPQVLYRFHQVLLALCLLLPALQPWRPRNPATGTTSIASRILFHPDSGKLGLAAFNHAELVLLVLAGGVLLRLLWLAIGLARLRRYRRSSHTETLPEIVRTAVTRLGAGAEFRISGDIQNPVTFGLRHPVVLLPPQFTALAPDRQQAVALHELVHVVRYDWAINLVEEIALGVFWFHPAVWWLVSRIRLVREQVVDEVVVEFTGARLPYLYTLVEMTAGPDAARALAAPAFLQESQLVERIRILVRRDTMSNKRVVLLMVCVAVVTLLAVVATVHKFPLRTGGASSSASPSIATGNVLLPPANAKPGIGQVYTVGKGVSAPVPIFKPEPPYTAQARAAKIQGVVNLSAIIGADGSVKDVSVLRPLDSGLDQNAVDTIKTWKFQPALKASQPVACHVNVEVQFKIF